MAANILKEMRAAGHPLDTCTLNHALSVLTLAQRTRQAFEFYEAMFQSGTSHLAISAIHRCFFSSELDRKPAKPKWIGLQPQNNNNRARTEAI
jgi:hypothetical protein